MLYLKSVLAGFLALVMAFISLLVAVMFVMIVYARTHTQPGEGSIGWDPISLVKLSPFLPGVVVVVVFLVGFFWKYRRLTHP
jgi:hypothetical protein